MKPVEYTGASVFHKNGYDGKGMVIAIVDSGVAKHPDLTILPGWGYQGIPPDEDASGHGTHVAGIAAGKKYGVAPGAKILPVRITSASSATAPAMEAGLKWLLEWVDTHNERLVVNISYSGTTSNSILYIIDELVAKHVPVCVAAGNDGKELSELGYYQSPIVVGNITGEGELSKTSNCRGKETDCVTVGSNVISCDKDGGYSRKSGTSMASPAIAGMLACLLSRYPNMREPELVQKLLSFGEETTVKCHSGKHALPYPQFTNDELFFISNKIDIRKMKIGNLDWNKAAVIRKTPGGEKIGNIRRGKIVVLLAAEGGYRQIAFAKSGSEVEMGWVAEKYLEVMEE